MPLARLGSLVEATAVALAPLEGETLDDGKGVLLVAANGATVRFFTTRACTSDAHVVTRGDVKRIRLQGVARVHGLRVRKVKSDGETKAFVLAYGAREAHVVCYRGNHQEPTVETRVAPTRHWILAGAWYDEEGRFVLGTADNSVSLWHGETAIWQVQGEQPSFALYAMDLRVHASTRLVDVVVGTAFGDVAVWRVAERTAEPESMRWRAHAGAIMKVRWADDCEDVFATASDDRTACLWCGVPSSSSKPPRAHVRLVGFGARVWDCAVLRDASGFGIAACGEDGTCRVAWQTSEKDDDRDDDGSDCEVEGYALTPLPCHVGYSGAWRLDVLTNLQLVATAGADGGVKLWNLTRRGDLPPLATPPGKARVRQHRNSKRRRAKLRRGSGAENTADEIVKEDVDSVPRLAPGIAPVTTNGQSITAFRWRTPAVVAEMSSREFVRCVAFDGTGLRVVVGTQHGGIFVLTKNDGAQWNVVGLRKADGRRVMNLACMGNYALAATDNGTVEAWDLDEYSHGENASPAFEWRAADAPEDAASPEGPGAGRLVDFALANGVTASLSVNGEFAYASTADSWVVCWKVDVAACCATRAGAGKLDPGSIATAAVRLPRWLVAGNAEGDIFVFAHNNVSHDVSWPRAHKLCTAHNLEVSRLEASYGESFSSYGVDGRVCTWTLGDGSMPPRMSHERAFPMHLFGGERAFGASKSQQHDYMVGYTRDCFAVLDAACAITCRHVLVGSHKRAWAYSAHPSPCFACFDARADELRVACWNEDDSCAPASDVQPLAKATDGWEMNAVSVLHDGAGGAFAVLASEGGAIASVALPAQCDMSTAHILSERRWGRLAASSAATHVSSALVADGTWYVVVVGSRGTLAAWRSASVGGTEAHAPPAERLALWDEAIASALAPEATPRHLSVAILPPHGRAADDARWRVAVGTSNGSVRMFAAPRPDGGGEARFDRLSDLRSTSATGVAWGIAAVPCLDERVHAVVAASTDGGVMAWRVDGTPSSPVTEIANIHRGAALSASAAALSSNDNDLFAVATGGDDERVVILVMRLPQSEQGAPVLLARLNLSTDGLGGASHAGSVRGISLCADASGGALAASAGLDGYVRLWRLRRRGDAWDVETLSCMRTDVVEANAISLSHTSGAAYHAVVAGKGIEAFLYSD